MPFEQTHKHPQTYRETAAGFSFLEVVISIAIILISLIGVIGLLNISNSMADTAERRSAVTDVIAQIADELRSKPFTTIADQDSRPIATDAGNVIVSVDIDDSTMPGLLKTASITAYLEGMQNIEEQQTVVIRNEHPEEPGGGGGGGTGSLSLTVVNMGALSNQVISGTQDLYLSGTTGSSNQLVRVVARIQGGDEIGRIETPAKDAILTIPWSTGLGLDGIHTIIFELWDNQPAKIEQTVTVFVDNKAANLLTAPNPKTVNVRRINDTTGEFSWTPYRDGRSDAVRHKILIFEKSKSNDAFPTTPKNTIVVNTANSLPTGTVTTSYTYTGFVKNKYYKAEIIPGCPPNCIHVSNNTVWSTVDKILWNATKW